MQLEGHGRPPGRVPVADHVRIAAILRIVYSSLGFILAAGVFLFFGGVSAIVAPFLALVGTAMAVIMMVCAAPSLITAWGMLRFRPWARILGILFAAIDLFNFPVGTALGAYTLWVLLHPAAVDLFEQGGPIHYPYG
jgi:hypothetical protein